MIDRVSQRRSVADDEELRRQGFTIHARPKDGPAVWRDKDGKLLPHDVAIVKAVNRKREKV